MKRKVCVLLLAGLLCLTLCGCSSTSNKEGTSGLVYEPEVGGYIVTGYDGIAADIVIPDKYEDGPVVAVRGHALESQKITSVKLGKNIKEIDQYAFFCCRELTSAVLNEGLTRLTGFSNCHSLKEITVPSTVTTIDMMAFDYATSMEKVEFAKGSQLTDIESSAFRQCVSLKEINLKDTNVRKIDSHAFQFCIGIKELYLPPTCTQFGAGAFEGWTADQTIYMGCPKDSIEACSGRTVFSRDDFSDDKWENILNQIFEGCEAKIVYP